MVKINFDLINSVPVVLVGNKTDLHQERAVSYEEGKKLAESWRATFLETSAKQNEVSDFMTKSQIHLLISSFFLFFRFVRLTVGC